MIPITLVSGGNYQQRESAIAAAVQQIPPTELVVVLLEGLPSGTNALIPTEFLQIHRIAPGCPCCIGNITMRVTLNRIVRLTPKRLILAISDEQHLDTVIQFLESEPYSNLLFLDQQILCGNSSS